MGLELSVLLCIALGYGLGSIPFGLVLPLLAGVGDIRKIGSGNIGATNVLRTGRKGLALAVLLLDSGKGALAVGLAFWGGVELSYPIAVLGAAAGVAAVIGHNFPAWLGFKGGKGIATTLGTLLMLSPLAGLGACVTWLLVASVFRFSSLAGMMSLAAAPLYAWVWEYDWAIVWGSLILAVLGCVRHKDNIRRLMAGTEPKIGQKKDAA